MAVSLICADSLSRQFPREKSLIIAILPHRVFNISTGCLNRNGIPHPKTIHLSNVMHTGLKKKSDTGCILEMALAAVSKEGNTFGEGGELKLAVQ